MTTAAPASNITTGVTLITELLIQQTVNLTNPHFVINEDADFNNYLLLGLPFMAFWFAGVGFVSYFTDEDGYVIGPRRIESDFLWYRFLSTFLTYVVEGLQIAACAFGAASTRNIKGGEEARAILSGFLFQGGDFFAAFPAICAVQIIFIVFMVIPIVLWRVLDRENYTKFADVYVHGRFGRFISFMQDLFMVYLVIPFFITLLYPTVCEYYLTGEDATALERTTECNGSVHIQYSLIGGLIALVSFIIGVLAGTVPVLVERSTDTALNGRYVSIAFAVKACMAMCYVLFQERHQFFHMGSIFFLQSFLLFMNVSLRPCLIERINFHRSAAFTLAMLPTMTLLIASGLDDILNPLPPAAGITAACCTVVMLAIKYLLIPCGKIFPAIPFQKGEYEGGICLGWGLPHGHGILRWDEESRTFAGSFLFGRYHGYGVMTQYKLFFQGMHSWGVRSGFGVTNIMDDEEEEYYEGMWADDKYHGEGTKKWKNGDTYQGEFNMGVEDGHGKWEFDTSLQRAEVDGNFDEGVFTKVMLQEYEVYEGDMRYGVPHGLGTLTVDDDVSDGEWRAGKLHGHGTLRTAAGEYEGLFIQGAFNEEGTWKDEFEKYKGGWKDGRKHGTGVQEMEGSGTYDGQFFEDMRHGYGTFTYLDGTVYQGSWQENDYHGTGLLTTSDGAEYDGNWINGERHGTRGCITYPTGESYVGAWENNKYHDQGILKIPDMGEYNGKFEFGKRHGLGRMTFYDGSEYVGDWAEDFANGQGTFVFASRKAIRVLEVMSVEDAAQLATTGDERIFLDYGGVYKGAFENGTMNGYGKVTGGDGTTYDGEWIEGLPHGKGILCPTGGGRFEGSFFGGLRDGIGTMSYADDRLYRGSWEEGKRHGHGVLFAANGDVLHDCEWIKDVPNDGTGVSHAIPDIPEVDPEEFLRAILPAQGSAAETEEHQFRKRIEVEQRYEWMWMEITLQEELTFTRIAKQWMWFLERPARIAVDQEEDAEFRVAAKPILAKLLNTWKAEFRTEFGKEPKKSDILKNAFVAPLYLTYMEIK